MSVIENSGDVKKFFVSSGSITINDDSSGKYDYNCKLQEHLPHNKILKLAGMEPD